MHAPWYSHDSKHVQAQRLDGRLSDTRVAHETNDGQQSPTPVKPWDAVEGPPPPKKTKLKEPSTHIMNV